MEKNRDVDNPRKENILLRLFKIMVEDIFISTETRERIRKKLKENIRE